MIIFLGDKPSPKMKPDALPFEGAACEKRLRNWLNILGYPDAKALKIPPSVIFGSPSESIILNQCDVSYTWLRDAASSGNKLIALGDNAAKAIKNLPHFKLPHPSGRNRLINDQDFVKNILEEGKVFLADSDK